MSPLWIVVILVGYGWVQHTEDKFVVVEGDGIQPHKKRRMESQRRFLQELRKARSLPFATEHCNKQHPMPGHSVFGGVATRARHVAIARPSRKPKSLHCTPQCWSVAGGYRCPSHPSQPGNLGTWERSTGGYQISSRNIGITVARKNSNIRQ